MNHLQSVIDANAQTVPVLRSHRPNPRNPLQRIDSISDKRLLIRLPAALVFPGPHSASSARLNGR
jgi:hypothetical protein